jgi:hypothetical protein
MARKNSDECGFREQLRLARTLWPGQIGKIQVEVLRSLATRYLLSVATSGVLLLNGRWYVTHSGLLHLANRRHCSGIRVQPVNEFCSPQDARWAFKATVYKTRNCKGFVGYGDANPSNVSSAVRGAEMRVAETRAVNRALRKAYGIGICSVEELGSLSPQGHSEQNVRKLPPQSANGNGQPRLRDQLCVLIRQHGFDASQVKQYAAEFCGVPDIRQASREQIQSFITHLTESATKDRDGLRCKLNSYPSNHDEGAA